ncbi:hypothetical protein Fmac_007963 [Flemingia macrophylla]|uniref:Uncharacterized protein n=1 Tax=Flemingia macrophylla TaxID=520843 RepID=A0ABD1MX80_9FABA
MVNSILTESLRRKEGRHLEEHHGGPTSTVRSPNPKPQESIRMRDAPTEAPLSPHGIKCLDNLTVTGCRIFLTVQSNPRGFFSRLFRRS